MIKSKALLIFSCIYSAVAFAQPSVTQIKADVKKTFPTATLIDVSATGTTSKEVENNVLTTLHRQNVNVTVPAKNPKFPNAKWVYRGAVKYQRSGSGFSFVKFNPGDEYLEGMPAPNNTEILAFLNANKTQVFTNKYNYLNEPANFQLGDVSKFKWFSFDKLYVEAITKYEKIDGNTSSKLITEKMKLFVFGKDGSNWKTMQPTGGKDFDSEKILEEKKYKSGELQKIKTWGDQVALAEANIAWASLQPLTIPVFKSIYEAAAFVNDILLQADKEKTKSLMYHMLAKGAFQEPDFKVLTRNGQVIFDNFMTASVNGDFLYKDQFCSLVDVKETGGSYIDVYNKNKSSYSRFDFGMEGTQWKITNATFHVLDGKVADDLKAMACTKTSLSAVERGSQEDVSKLKTKDYVLAYYESDGYWYPSFYLGYENYYYNIQYFIDNSKGKVRKVIPMNIKAGDKAFVKTQSGNITEVTVKSISGLNVVIDYNGQNTNYKISGLLFK